MVEQGISTPQNLSGLQEPTGGGGKGGAPVLSPFQRARWKSLQAKLPEYLRAAQLQGMRRSQDTSQEPGMDKV